MFKRLQHIIVSLVLLLCSTQAFAQSALPDTVCVGANKTYSVNTVSPPAGSSYTWQVNGVTQPSASNQVSITWNNPGTYMVTVVEHNTAGCDGDTVKLPVVVYPAPSVIINSSSVCSGSDATVTATPSPGGTYTYAWMVPAGATNPGDVASFTTNIAGTYIVTITNPATHCTASDTTTVSFITGPTVTATPPSQAICSGQKTNISLTSTDPNATISWIITQSGVSGGFDAAGPKISQTLTTVSGGTAVYQVRATNFTTGCSGTPINVTVTVNPLPGGSISYAGTPFCATGTAAVTLNAGSGGNYFSTPSGLVIDASTGLINLGTSQPGSYTIKYAFSNGTCADTVSTSVTINALPTLDLIAPAAVCAPNTVDLTSAVQPTTNASGISYWTDALATNPVTNPSAVSVSGLYYIKATLGSCSLIKSVQVTVNARPGGSISYAGTPFCATGTAAVTLNAGSGGNYFSTPSGLVINASTGLINLGTSQPGSYTIKYAFSNGTCADTVSTSVTINALPTLDLIAPAAVCAPNTVDLTSAVQPTTNASGISYWTDALATNPVTNPSAVSVSGLYYIKATLGSCSVIKSVQVTVNARPGGSISYAGTPFCATGTAAVTLNAGSGGNYFSTPSGLVIDASTGLINLGTSQPGSYTIKYAFSNGTCADTVSTSVTINALPTLDLIAPAAVCAPNTVDLTSAVQPTTNASGISYWTDALATNPVTNPSAISVSGLYYIKATLGSCSVIKSVQVTVNARPGGSISYAGTPFCATGTAAVTLNAGSGGNYFSTPSGLVINASTGLINLGTSQPGSYTIKYAFSNGTCADTVSTSVTINALPTLDLIAPAAVCAPNTVDLTSAVQPTTNASGISYWTDALATNPVTNPSAVSVSGLYYIKATLGSCSLIKSVQVTVNARPGGSISYAGTPFCATGTAAVTLNAGSGGNYFSTPSGLVINASTGLINLGTSQPGSYTIKYAFSNGTCADTVSTSVTINALPTLDLIAPAAVCAPNTVDLTSAVQPTTNASGISYWTDALATNPVTNPSAVSVSGLYYIKATLGSCSVIKSVQVTVNARPGGSISYAGTPFCATGTAAVTLNAGSGGNYFSTPSGLVIDASTGLINLGTSQPGSYTIKYAFSNGTCADTVSTSVTINALPTLDLIAPAAVCAPNTVDLTSAVQPTTNASGISYWTDALATNPVTNPSAISVSGLYYIKATLGSCSVIKSVQVTVNARPVVSISYGITSFCAKQTATVTVSPLGGSFSSTAGLVFVSGTGNIDLAASTPGQYTVSYAYSNGTCADTAKTTITINALPTLNVTATLPAVCEPSTVNLVSAITFTNASSISYWEDATGFTTPVSSPTAVTQGGIYYIKALQNGTSCYIIKPVTVIINPLPVLSISNPDVCGSGTADLTAAAVTAGSTPTSGVTLTYWTDLAGTIPYTTPTTAPAGQYYIRSTINATGCNVIKRVVVVDIGGPAPILTIVDNCGNSVITAKDASGNIILGSELTWSNGQTGNPITVTATTAVTATRAANGCSSGNSNSVTPAPKSVPAAPVLTVADNCDNTSTITAKDASGNIIPAAELTWSNGQPGNPIAVTTTAAVTAIRTVSGCVSGTSNSVIPAPKTGPSAPVLTVADNCGNSVITAKDASGNIIPAAELTWSNGQSGNPITVTATTAVTAIRTVNGCASGNSNSVTPAPKATPSAPVLTVIDNCGNSVITAKDASGNVIPASELTWSNGQTGNPITVTTTAAVTAIRTVSGCASLASNSIVPAPKTVPSAPVLTVTDNCNNTSVITAKDASGNIIPAAELTWSNGQTGNPVTVATTAAVTAIRTVNGCASGNSNSVIPAPGSTPAPVLTVTDNCGNSVITAKDASGNIIPGSELTWSNGQTGNPITVTATTAVTAIRTVNGCASGNSNSVIPAPGSTPAPVLTVTDNCGNSVITAKDASGNIIPGSELTWSNGQTGNPITVTATTAVTAIRTVNGCASGNSNSVIPAPGSTPAPVLTVTDNCGNSVITAKDANGNVIPASELTWSNGQTGNPITVTTTAAVTAIRTVNGCASGNSNSVIPAPGSTPAPVLTVTDNCGNSVITAKDANGNVIPASELTWSNGQTGNPITVTTTAAVTAIRTVNGCASGNSNSVIPAPGSTPAPVLTVTDNCGNSVITAKDANGNVIPAAELTWSNGQTGNPIIVTTTTPVTATRTVNGCVSPVSNSVTAAPKPLPSAPAITALQPTCTQGGSVTVTSPVSGLTYNLVDASGNVVSSNATGNFTNVAAGTYTVTATNACGTSAASNNVTITTAPTTPSAPQITAVQPTCSQGGSVTVTSPVSGVTYELRDASNNIISSNATGNFTNVSAGTYTVTATNACGTSAASNNVTITTAPTTPSAPAITAVQPTCTQGGSVTVTSPVSGLTYNLRDASGNVVTSNATGNFTNVAAGTYTVTATNACGTSAASNNVTITTAPTTPSAPAITAVQPTCTQGGSVTVTSPVSGLTYNLVDASGNVVSSNATGNFTNVAAGTYTVTATNACGTSAASNNVTITTAPTTPSAPQITAVQPTCSQGGSVTVTSPVSGVTYELRDASNNIISSNTTGSFANVTAGTYTVTATNSCGTSAASNQVTLIAAPGAPSAPQITAVQPTCTAAGSVSVTSPVSGVTYELRDASNNIISSNTTGSFSNVTAGTYTVTATNSCGTSAASNQVTLIAAPGAPSAPQITAVQPTCTAAGSVSVTSPVSGVTYELRDAPNNIISSNTTGSFTNVTAGTYTVTATNSCGTSAASNQVILIAAPGAPSAPQITAVQPTCTAAGSVNVTSPVSGVTYELRDASNNIISSNTTGNFTNVTAGTYTVTATNSCGTSAASNQVTLIAAPGAPSAPQITAVQPTCTAAGSVSVTSPVSGVTYELRDASNNIISSNTTGSFSNVTAGTYTVTATNSCGTSAASNQVTLIAAPGAPSAPQITAVQPTCTQGGSVTVTSPVSGVTYELRDASNNIISSNTTGSFTNVTAGTYTVTATNSCGTSAASNQVILIAAPGAPSAPQITAVQPTCTAAGLVSVTLPVSGVTYELRDASNNIISSNTTGSFNNVTAGTYTVTATNACGTSAASNQVTLIAAPGAPSAPQITAVQPTCTAAGSVSVTSPVSGVTYELRDASNNIISSNTTGSFSNVTAGTYTVTATNSCGTSAASNQVTLIAAPGAPSAPQITAVQPTCTAAGSVSVTSPVSGVTYELRDAPNNIISSNTTGSFTNVTAGTYTVTATNSCGTSAASNQVILIAAPGAPSAPQITAVQPTCTAAGSVNVTSPVSGVTYELRDASNNIISSNTTGNFTNVTAGTYTVTATNSCGTSAASNQVTLIAAPGAPSAPQITAVQPTCTAAGSVSVTSPVSGVTYELRDASNNIISSNTTGSFSNVTAGTYTVTATNSCGTSAASNQVTLIAAPGAPSAPQITAVQPTCTAAGSVSVTSPVSGVTYELRDASNNIISSNTTGSFTNVTAGTYTVTATNSCGTSAASNQVTLIAAPGAPSAPQITAVQPTCTAAGSVSVTSPVSGVTYELRDASNNIISSNTTGSFTNVTAGTYTVTATNSCGTSAASNQVTLIAAPGAPSAPQITAVQPTCTAAGSVSVTSPVSGVTYELRDASNNIISSNTTGSFANVTAGTYTVTATNSCGTSAASNQVTLIAAPGAPSAPQITAVQPTCTAAGSVSVTSPVSGVTYELRDASNNIISSNTTGNFTNVTAGTYTVTATNSCGTSAASNQVTLIAAPGAPSAPQITAVQPTCTAAGSVSVTSPVSGVTYELRDAPNNIISSNTTGSFTNVTAGTYTVTATNSCGTSAASNQVILIAAPGAPSAPQITAVQPTCTAAGSVNVTSPVSGVTYELRDASNNIISSNTTGNFTNVTAGTYTVTATNSCGTSAASNQVTLIAAPGAPSAPQITAVQPTCTAAGSVSVTSPVSGVTYELRDASNNIISSNTTGSFSNVTAGTYTVTATNSCGTSAASNQVTLIAAPGAPSAPQITAVQPTCTQGGSVTVTSPVSGLTYNLVDASGNVVASNTTGNFSNVTAGTYTVTATNSCGTSSASNQVTLIAAPGAPSAPQITAVQPTCTQGGSVTVTSPVSGLTYNLVDASGNVVASNTTGIFTNVTAGTYTVTATNSCGTSAASNQVALIAATVPAPTVIVTNNCASSTLTAGNLVNGATLLWSNGSTTNPITVTVPGTYTVTQTLNGCTSQPGSGNAAPNPAPTATISGGTFCGTGSTTLTTTGATGGTFSASPSGLSIDPNTGAINLATSTPGTYTVTYAFGTAPCNGSAANTVIVNAKPTADAPANVTSCASYTLPALNNGAYYSASNGVGPIAVGTTLTTTQTIYVYAGSAGCSDEHSFVVTITSKPVADAPPNVTACGSYTLPPLTNGNYFSSPGGSGPIPAGTVVTTTRTIYVYAGNSPSCSDEHSFVVTITQKPTADAPQNVTSCASYVLPALNSGAYYSSPNGVGPIAVGTAITATQTIYVYAGTAGCSDEHSFVVTITAKPLADAPPNVTACAAYTLPALTNGNYFSSPGGAAPIPAGTVITNTQTIYVYAGNSPTCSSENSFTVTITQRPVADKPQNVTSCASYILPALNVGAYYSSPNGVGPIAVGTVLTTTQTVYVYAGTPACFDQNSFVVTITTKPVADAPQNVTSCASYTLPPLNNGAYFTSPNGVGPIAVGTVLATTQTVYVFAGSASCYDEHSFVVTITPRPPADAPQNVTSCASYALPALTNGSYFTSQNGVGPIAAGTVITSTQTIYVYAGTPACFTENSFTVTITARPVADAPADVNKCGSYTLPALTNGAYYSSPNGVGPIAAGTTITNTQIIYVYAGTAFCNDQHSFTVTITPIVTPSVAIATSSTSICLGSSATFTATPVNPGTAPVYQWLLNGTAIPGATSVTYTTSALSNGDKITFTMVSNAPCATVTNVISNEIAMTVTSVTPAVSIVSSATTICAGTSVTFTATPVNGGSAPAYQWQVNGTDVSGATSATFTSSGLNNGDKVTVNLTSNASCTTTPFATSNPVTMVVNPLPVLVITDPQGVCFPSTVDITAASVTAGSGANLTYTYFTDAAASNILTNPNAVGATGVYYIKATSQFGCITIKPVTVTINPLPVLVVNDPAAVCYPATVDITAPAVTTGSGANLTYTYFTDAAATNVLTNPNAVNASGVYYIKATTVFGCVTVKPVTVIINPLPTADISGGGVLCRGDSKKLTITLTGTAPWTVNYSNGTSTITINGITTPTYILNVSPTVNTTYTLVNVTDANCFNTATGSTSISVGTPIAPVRYTSINATAGLPKVLSPGARVFTATDQYTWNPSVGLNAYTVPVPTFTYNRTTEYLVTIAAGTGCTVVDTLLVNVYPASGPPAVVSTIFVPKAFSPNGDGHNDKLTPLLFRIKDLYYFRVFNRWGQLVFETKIMGEGWDGTFKGVKLGPDVFTWTAAGVGTDGRTHDIRGQTILLK